jgi:23S rRNA pseudouridine2604 synthase
MKDSKGIKKDDSVEIEYPVRINRYLHLTGVCSRRAADRLIEQHEISINGKVAVLGQKVNKGDTVSLGKQAKTLQGSYKYYLYNKPVGVVSHNPQSGEQSAVMNANLPPDFAPVGRLDKASEGLMLLTNDGRIVDKLLNPTFKHDREYLVKLDKPIKNHDIKILSQGVDIEGYRTQPAEVSRIHEAEILMILTEGKKHQIRRMCAALGYQVTSLRRVSIMDFTLEGISIGHARALTQEESDALLTKLGVIH